MVLYVRYADKPETPVYETESGKRVVNKVLLGTYLGVMEESSSRLRVVTAGPDGWVERDDAREDACLKMFFVDVGQGDGVLVEAPGKRGIVDGGPDSCMYRYLKGWQYSYLLRAGEIVSVDAVVASHFDADHYAGLIPVIATLSSISAQLFTTESPDTEGQAHGRTASTRAWVGSLTAP